jgi:hypothetical protein
MGETLAKKEPATPPHPHKKSSAMKDFAGKILKTLRLKEAPYAVTFLVAALAWSVTHIVDRLIQMPIIEYNLSDPQTMGSRVVKCEVTNICDKVFRNLNLYLSAAEGAKIKISDPEIGFIKPIMPDQFQSRAAYIQGDNAAYFVPELQPECSASIEARINGVGSVDLRYNSGTESIRLIERGFETWLVKNEIAIMISLFVFWLAVLVLYVCLVL